MARIEWNGLPGYLAAERMPGEVRERWNRLGLFDADTLNDFLREPVEALEKKMFERGKEAGKNGVFRRSFDSDEDERHLLTLIMRFATVCVMAERERVREEEEHEQRERQRAA